MAFVTIMDAMRLREMQCADLGRNAILETMDVYNQIFLPSILKFSKDTGKRAGEGERKGKMKALRCYNL